MISLRLRLFLIILTPLLLIAIGLAYWWTKDARSTTEMQYDNSLLFTALSVSKDVALRSGDAISSDTENLLSKTAGGPVRYHVYAPDGVFVTGYAVPPIPIGTREAAHETYSYFDARSKGRNVRVLQLTYITQISGFSGPFTITVWQEKSIRQDFIRQLVIRALVVIGAMFMTVAIVVWFGVNLGLKPLLDLEEAISIRNPKDLTPIKRVVPPETKGLVFRFNELIRQVSSSMEAQSNFISDAAHQLRNPIAGVRALGEAILTAKTLKDAHTRAAHLVKAAEQTSHLANKLLTLERVRASEGIEPSETVDLIDIANSVIGDFAHRAKQNNVKLPALKNKKKILISADATMLREAIINLIDNAFIHGGSNLSKINVSVKSEYKSSTLIVSDDGNSIDEKDIPKILARFGQAGSNQGSGLGLSIASAIAKRYDGELRIGKEQTGFSVSLRLPTLLTQQYNKS